MTLIKEMLENLDRRNGSDPNKQEPERRNRPNKSKKPKKYKDILTQRFWLGSLVTASSFVVLIAAFFLIYNSYTNKGYTAHQMISKNATAVPAKKMEYRTVTSNTVHQMYLSAINDLNEGKVEKALAELKIILKEDPKFSPARETYQAIQSRYGIGINNSH